MSAAHDIFHPRAIIAIDPGETSGVALWREHDLEAWELVRADTVKLSAAGFSEEDAIVLIHSLLENAEWLAAVERPFDRAGPVAADRFWRRVLDLVARRRIAGSGRSFRKPCLLRPMHQTWRSPLGLRTRSIHAHTGRGAPELKQAAIAWLKYAENFDVAQPDAAEACCIGAWASRLARLGVAQNGQRVVQLHFVP